MKGYTLKAEIDRLVAEVRLISYSGGSPISVEMANRILETIDQ